MAILAKSETSKPAKRSTPRPSSAAQQVAQNSQQDRRIDGLDGVWQMLSVVCIARQQYADAAAFGSHGHPISVELAKLANSNESIAKAVDFITSSGPYSALITATLPLALQLAANHNMVKADSVAQFGITPPELLSKRMELETQKKLAEIQAEIDALNRESSSLAA